MNINLIPNDYMYKWTALYSGNFNSTHLNDFNFNWRNYSKKPIQVKLAQFKIDWQRNQRSNKTQHVSVVIQNIMSNLKPE